MLKRLSYLLLIILIILLWSIPMPVFAGDGVDIIGKGGDGIWVGNTWQVSLMAGETKACTITVKNRQEIKLGVTVEVTTDATLDDNVCFEYTPYIIVLSQRTKVITISAIARNDARPDIYSATIQLDTEEAPSEGGGDGGSYIRPTANIIIPIPTLVSISEPTISPTEPIIEPTHIPTPEPEPTIMPTPTINPKPTSTHKITPTPIMPKSTPEVTPTVTKPTLPDNLYSYSPANSILVVAIIGLLVIVAILYWTQRQNKKEIEKDKK